MNVRPAVYLVDASIYVFRAWHALPPDSVDADGEPVHAVHGFARFLCELLEKPAIAHLAIAFDGSLTRSFRNEIYPPYKANRELPPPDLERQFWQCREISAALGLCTLIDERYEADDLIGSISHRLRAEARSVIVSPDKDFGQLLLSADDEQWDYARGRRWGPAGVFGKLGVQPSQVADFLALCGDAVDNIPGVPGIGAKTAAALLAHFGDLDSLLQRVEEIPFLRLRGAARCAQNLREHAAAARLYRRITAIALDAPGPTSTAELRRRPGDQSALATLGQQLRLGPLTRNRLAALSAPP